MRKRVLVRVAAASCVVAAAAVIALAMGLSQATSDPAPPPEPTSPAAAVEPFKFFTPYAADPGALSFEELDPQEQAVINAERGRESAAVLDARFATLRAMAVELGERTHASVSASMIGLEGLETEGVVP